MVTHYPITGVASVEPHPRKNINDLAKDPLEWNLLLEAFTRLQSQGEDVHSPLGFYQIAGEGLCNRPLHLGSLLEEKLTLHEGIHGVPFVQWMEEPDPDDRPGNYCTHGTYGQVFFFFHRVIGSVLIAGKCPLPHLASPVPTAP